MKRLETVEKKAVGERGKVFDRRWKRKREGVNVLGVKFQDSGGKGRMKGNLSRVKKKKKMGGKGGFQPTFEMRYTMTKNYKRSNSCRTTPAQENCIGEKGLQKRTHSNQQLVEVVKGATNHPTHM